MYSYLLQGVVHPERAQISLRFTVGFSHLTSKIEGTATANILFNQISLWVDSPEKWDIHDLKNVTKSILQNELAIVGYLKGYHYEVEMRRVINRDLEIDYVFGVDVPRITSRNKDIDLDEEIRKIRSKIKGTEGVFMHRCFRDLIAAMSNPDDTALYCYRAIESLRHHCSETNNLDAKNKASQWRKFREVAQCKEETIRAVKDLADPIRHGGIHGLTDSERAELFETTWDIVDNYLKNA